MYMYIYIKAASFDSTQQQIIKKKGRRGSLKKKKREVSVFKRVKANAQNENMYVKATSSLSMLLAISAKQDRQHKQDVEKP